MIFSLQNSYLGEMMEYFSDIFLGVAAICAAFYCLLLSRRLSRLRGLDQDLGGAIAVLSKQVDEMTEVLRNAQSSADASSSDLKEMAERAEMASDKLEVLVAAVHDLAEAPEPAAPPTPVVEVPAVVEEQPLFRRRARQSAAGPSS